MVHSSGVGRGGVAVVAIGVAALLAACSPTTAEGEEDPAAVSATSSATTSEAEAAGSPTTIERSSSTSTAKKAKDDGDRGTSATDGSGQKKTGASGQKSSDTKRYRVIRVVDGDTVKVDINGGESVRVIGIDAPETVHPDKATECGGPDASSAAEELLDGQRVELVFDSSQGRRDSYGRLLAYVEVPGTGDFGEAMLRKGHVREYTYGSPYQRQSTYRSAERQARTADQGLWDGCSQEEQPSSAPSPSSTAPSPSPSTQAPAAPEPPAAPAPAPSTPASAPGPGWTNDSLTPGYTGCRQGYPGGKINGVYWWKPISC